jgi:hypothetical protein
MLSSSFPSSRRETPEVVSSKQQIRSGELKRELQQRLGREIPYSTFSVHIQSMLDKKELKRNEKIVDRSKHVFYCMPSEIKKQAQLRLIRTDPKNLLFKQIFTNLFLKGLIEGTSYSTDDLDGLLHEIGATRQDLILDHIEYEYNKYSEGHVFGKDYVDCQLPIFTMIYYRPISHVRIVEGTSYRQNIFYHFCREYPAINFTVQGISIDDFTSMYYVFKVKREDAEEAFMMALKNGLIKPIRNRMKYVLADDALKDLISDVNSFHKLEDEFCYQKWNSICTPTEEEQEGIYSILTRRYMNDPLIALKSIDLILKRSKKQDRIIQYQQTNWKRFSRRMRI